MKTTRFFKMACFACVSSILLQSVDGINIAFAQESRPVKDFTEINCSISGHIYISQGATESLRLEGDADDLQKIITEVANGDLKIYTKGDSSSLSEIVIYISVKELANLSLSGSNKVEFQTPVTSKEFKISVSGSGNINLPKLTANEFEIHISGSGDVLCGGKIEDSFEIHISGSGDIKASDLEAKNVEVHVSGSGSAEVFATEKLESRISGSGGVFYKGRPLVDAASSGSGKTKPLD